MQWPSVAEITRHAPLPAGYRYELLNRRQIPGLISALEVWFPGIAVGNASCHLKPAFYEEKVVLDDSLSERDFLVILIKRGQDLVGLLSVERDSDSEVLYGRVGAISPQHRGFNLSERFPSLIEALGRAMRMGMVYGLATLKVPYMAEKFERLGWQLVGIIPGFDQEMVEPGVVKRVYEGIYTKVLVDEDDLVLPHRSAMTPKTAVLFDLLFPGKASVA